MLYERSEEKGLDLVGESDLFLGDFRREFLCLQSRAI